MIACATLVASCAGDFDTSRQTPPRGTLGREMYTLVCDRVGAQALREDVSGASFHSVCHADAAGAFADRVDESKLPALDPAARSVDGKPVPIEQQRKNRDHRIARIEALARRRDDLIRAFDLAVPEQNVTSIDPDSCAPRGDAELRDELGGMLGRLTDLYNDETIPRLTRGLARVMTDVEKAPDAQAALARFDARRGYRPADVGMGVARPVLAYPRLTELANAALRPMATGGNAHGALAALLAAVHEEMRTAKASPPAPRLTTTLDTRDPKLVRLSRPRGNLELARTILLARGAAFQSGTARFVVARDTRGVAKVALQNGRVPAPFLDDDGDGLADVDGLGRFVTSGAPAPSPFADVLVPKKDAQERAAPYEYIDVSQTFVASLAKDLVPLLDPDRETIMDFIGGLAVVAGGREDREKDYDGAPLKYRAYAEDDSPLLDLVHAIGQVLADPSTDDTLALLQRLVEDEPEVLARLVGVGLRIKAIADAHPEARIPDKSTLWDEMLDVVAQMAQRPRLLEDVIRAFGDDRTVDMPRSAIAYMTTRDRLSYDRNNLNGLPFNVTTGKVEGPKTPVDRSKPDTGWNRSELQRFLQTLHDTKGMSVCTKPGAVAHIVWNGLPMDFPSFTAQAACFTLGADPPPSNMPMCGMLRIENIAAELVEAVLGTVQLDIRDDCLRTLVSSPLTGVIGGADAFLENISGIRGWTTSPSVAAINRMVFFDLPQGGQPGDLQNTKTRNFFRDLFDPAPTLVCPAISFTDTDGTKLNLRQCGSFADTLRGRDSDALFPIEQLGFLEAAKPLARAFKDAGANLLFVDLFDVLHLHWGSEKQTKEECDPTLPKTNARWCSQDGVVTYEPLVAEALATDLFPALHDSVRELSAMTIPHCETRAANGTCTKVVTWDGVKVLAEALKVLVDPAKNQGLRRRNGDAGVTRNDGTKNTQVTPIYLLIDAIKGFDARNAAHAAAHPGDERLPAWRRARSGLVDQLFAVEGTGATSRLKNSSVRAILPVLVSALRAQLAARCPNPGSGCDWARKDLPNNARDVVTGPTFAGVLDVLDALRADPSARVELERLFVHLLTTVSPATLTALVDVLQVFEDDENVTALLHAGAGADEIVSSAIDVIARITAESHENGKRVCAKEIDPSRVLPVLLTNLVTPPAAGGQTPIEIVMDVVADVNRRNPEETTKLEADDYASIAHEVSDFCSHPSRGLEQVYVVIKQATKAP